MSTNTLQEKQTLLRSDFYSPSEIIELFESKEIEKDWSFAGYKPSDTSKLTHCYHRYPAKFIPQLVEKIEDEYLTGIAEPHVNDLFMGSGTTIVCAIARGYKASGTDINYISELITRVKSTPINPILLKEIRNIASKIKEAYSYAT